MVTALPTGVPGSSGLEMTYSHVATRSLANAADTTQQTIHENSPLSSFLHLLCQFDPRNNIRTSLRATSFCVVYLVSG
ncbi:hypothetical protein Pdw03_3312 [Penicillium digitatum]|uniref:Uncharacterized protein n=1 Tax=Penicillium digitatum TaxID=36651 RepID=A0A7T6XG13_PENDI|nr:hypothetical protein Pdw03_3312 [Penicillium digitatum]